MTSSLKTTFTYIEKSHSPVIVFDLDDTLFDSSFRTLQIFKEFFTEEKRKEFSCEYEKIVGLKRSNVKYRLKDTLISVGIRNEFFGKQLLSFWKEKFFNNEYIKYDQPNENAVEYCQQVANTQAKIFYLTGRQHQLRPGTFSSLKKFGFPQFENLITKEEKSEDDLVYKTREISKLKDKGEIVAVFENEPRNLQAMQEVLPMALAFFMNTRFSDKSNEIKLKNIIEIVSF